MRKISYIEIGVIRSPFADVEGMPIQPEGAKGVAGSVELNPEYAEGLKDLEGFSHVLLIYRFHRSEGYSLLVKPFMDSEVRGLFATRAPRRPNPIGISVVRLVRIEGPILYIEDVDILDGTPLLDIKPFVPAFDCREAERIGWLSERADKVSRTRADKRFKQ